MEAGKDRDRLEEEVQEEVDLDMRSGCHRLWIKLDGTVFYRLGDIVEQSRMEI